MQNPKTRVKSFRLHEELLETLRIAASRHGVTENTLVETFLTSRFRVDPILLAFDVISVGRETFMQIIGAANIDGLEAFAPTQGKKSFSLAKQLFASNDMQLSFFKYLTEILGERARWFHTEGTLVKPELITLYHPYGTKWSAFLKSFISSAYEVISRDKLKIDITNDFVSIQFPNPTTSL